MKLLITILLTVIISAGTNAALINGDGRPYETIVIAENAPDSVKLAANELRDFLKKLCNADLPIEFVPKDGRMTIYVGNHPDLVKFNIDPTTLPSDGFVIRSVPDALVIAGKDYTGKLFFGWSNPWRDMELYHYELKNSALGEEGTLYGVYHFLETVGGVRFYWPNDLGTVLTPQKNIRVGTLDIHRAPRFTYRYPWFSFLKNDRDGALWLRRAGFGGKAPVMIIHSYDLMNRYQQSNPEYFALVDGKRAFNAECVADGKGHLCLNNPELIRRWADTIIAYFDQNPEMEVFPLAPNDGLTRICECPPCNADDRPNAGPTGRFSYHIWNFTNKVARMVAEKHPDKFVGCIAYERYRDIPEDLQLAPNVAVMFCNWRSMLGNPEERKKLHAAVDRWSQQAGRMYFWSWYLDHWAPTDHLPILFSSIIEEEISRMGANPKFYGEFIESENRAGQFPFGYDRMGTPGMQHLNLYLTARLHWDPTQKVQVLLDEYFSLFYGPAEKPMRQFWMAAEARRNELLQQKPSPAPDELFSPAFLTELAGYLAQAKALAPAESDYARRIDVVAKEFAVGAGRLSRILQQGRSKLELREISAEGNVNKVKPMRFFTASAEAANPNTFLAAGYDRQYFYLRFLCFEPRMDQIKTVCIERDQNGIWDDDSIEILLAPDLDKLNDCYQLIVNAGGVWFDGKKITAAATDTAWDANAQVQVRREASRWVVDIRIPWISLGINDPNFTGNLAANFYRNRTANGRMEHFMWSPTGESAHFVPEKFGLIEIKK